MTFLHPRVLDHLDKSFVAAVKIVDPGYMGPGFDRARIQRVFGPDADPNMTEDEFHAKLTDRVPSATANNDVALAFATGDGQLLHVLPGIWNGERCADEMDYALALADRLEGLPLAEQHQVISTTHHERLAKLDDEPHEGLGQAALKHSLETTAAHPARNLLELPEQEEWSSDDRLVGYPYRTLHDMGWMQTYIVSHTVSQANGVSPATNLVRKVTGFFNPSIRRMRADKQRCRAELGHTDAMAPEASQT